MEAKLYEPAKTSPDESPGDLSGLLERKGALVLYRLLDGQIKPEWRDPDKEIFQILLDQADAERDPTAARKILARELAVLLEDWLENGLDTDRPELLTYGILKLVGELADGALFGPLLREIFRKNLVNDWFFSEDLRVTLAETMWANDIQDEVSEAAVTAASKVPSATSKTTRTPPTGEKLVDDYNFWKRLGDIIEGWADKDFVATLFAIQASALLGEHFFPGKAVMDFLDRQPAQTDRAKQIYLNLAKVYLAKAHLGIHLLKGRLRYGTACQIFGGEGIVEEMLSAAYVHFDEILEGNDKEASVVDLNQTIKLIISIEGDEHFDPETKSVLVLSDKRKSRLTKFLKRLYVSGKGVKHPAFAISRATYEAKGEAARCSSASYYIARVIRHTGICDEDLNKWVNGTKDFLMEECWDKEAGGFRSNSLSGANLLHIYLVLNFLRIRFSEGGDPYQHLKNKEMVKRTQTFVRKCRVNGSYDFSPTGNNIPTVFGNRLVAGIRDGNLLPLAEKPDQLVREMNFINKLRVDGGYSGYLSLANGT